jgi:hypothetical protein
MNRFIPIIFLIFFSTSVFAENNIDQWIDSEKTYKDLIEEGFEVKAYDTNTINVEDGLIILLFITVLQKEKEIYECQEYQTLDSGMKTLDLSLVCRELSQPYQRGIGT